MPIRKYSHLKIAGHTLGFTMKAFAAENGTSIQVIRDVAKGYTTSARLSEAIDEAIEEADKVLAEHRKNKLSAN